MANDLLLPIQAGNLPSGFCPTTFQDMLVGFSAVQNAVLTGGGSAPVASGFVVSATKPTDTTVAWFQLDSSGRPTRLYYFLGAWLSLHPIQPGLTMWWFNALPDFNTFDGGDSSTPNTAGTAGKMWNLAVDANNTPIAAQFPIAAGTLPSGTILSVPGSGGEENHVLSAGELAPHTHLLDNAGLNGTANTQSVASASGVFAGDRTLPSSNAGKDIATKPNVAGGTGGIIASGHNNMPPYVVGYLLQRTGRLYYKVT